MNIRGVFLASVVFLSCVLAPAAAQAAIVLLIPGVAGDSVVPGFTGQIDIQSLQLGAGRGCSSSSPLSVSEITVTKTVDQSSVDLSNALRDHTVYPTATFSVLNPSNLVKVTYQMTNALVTGLSQSTGGDLPSESISFTFSQVTIGYFVTAGAGKASEISTLVLPSCP